MRPLLYTPPSYFHLVAFDLLGQQVSETEFARCPSSDSRFSFAVASKLLCRLTTTIIITTMAVITTTITTTITIMAAISTITIMVTLQ